MKTSGLVSTIVTADRCLFAAVPGAGQPMVEVEGAELDRTAVNGLLRWTPQEANRFANFDQNLPVVIVKPDPTSTQNWTWNEWIQFAREKGTPVGKVQFKSEPEGLKELANLIPDWVEVKNVEFPELSNAEKGDAGADPERVASPPESGKE
jgi:hypothetical protein